MEAHKMTPKEKRFVQEYLIDPNATQAAIKAGYSKATAKQQGSRLLTQPDVQEAVAEGQSDLATRCKVTAEMIVAELAKVGFANAGDYFDWGPEGITIKNKDTLTPEQQAAVSEVYQTTTGGEGSGGTIRVKLHDKLAALEKLGKHLGMFVDRIDLTLLPTEKLLDMYKRMDAADQIGTSDPAKNGGSILPVKVVR